MSKRSKARSAMEKDPALNAKRRRAMVQYLAIMFIVAVILVVFSLFISLRDSKQDLQNEKNNSFGLQEKGNILQQKSNAYEWLAKAQLDLNKEDMKAFVSDMRQLMSISDVLTDNGKELYESLMEEYNAYTAGETTEATQSD